MAITKKLRPDTADIIHAAPSALAFLRLINHGLTAVWLFNDGPSDASVLQSAIILHKVAVHVNIHCFTSSTIAVVISFGDADD